MGFIERLLGSRRRVERTATAIGVMAVFALIAGAILFAMPNRRDPNAAVLPTPAAGADDASPEGFLPYTPEPFDGGLMRDRFVVRDAPSFGHPDVCVGPDGAVTSYGVQHCGDLLFDRFSMPARSRADGGAAFGGYFAMRRSDDWHPTGYTHGDGQLWQGDDPRFVYLVHADREDLAVVYAATNCA